eukprot:768650-Hanusia_phi.AAC.10
MRDILTTRQTISKHFFARCDKHQRVFSSVQRKLPVRRGDGKGLGMMMLSRSKDTTVCEEQYIVLSRINEPVTAGLVQHVECLRSYLNSSLAASDIISLLAASDAQPTIFAFHSLDADANVVELSNSLTDAGSSPILPLLACDDSDRYQEDPRLIWGGCATYLPGACGRGRERR